MSRLQRPRPIARTNDPRLSVEERYGTIEGICASYVPATENRGARPLSAAPTTPIGSFAKPHRARFFHRRHVECGGPRRRGERLRREAVTTRETTPGYGSGAVRFRTAPPAAPSRRTARPPASRPTRIARARPCPRSRARPCGRRRARRPSGTTPDRRRTARIRSDVAPQRQRARDVVKQSTTSSPLRVALPTSGPEGGIFSP